MNDLRSRAADRRDTVWLSRSQTILIKLNGTVTGLCRIFGNVRIRKKESRVAVREFDRNGRIRAGPTRTVLSELVIPRGSRLALSNCDITLRKYLLRCHRGGQQQENDPNKTMLHKVLVRYFGPAIIVRIGPATVRHRGCPIRTKRILIVSIAAETLVKLAVLIQLVSVERDTQARSVRHTNLAVLILH